MPSLMSASLITGRFPLLDVPTVAVLVGTIPLAVPVLELMEDDDIVVDAAVLDVDVVVDVVDVDVVDVVEGVE